MVDDDKKTLRIIYNKTRGSDFSWLDTSKFEANDFDRDTKGEKVWISEHSGSVVGFISAWIPENFIHHLFVLPEFSSFGHGSKLLHTCLTQVGRPAQLKCVANNTKAIDFYLSKGWIVVSSGQSSDGKYHLMQLNET